MQGSDRGNLGVARKLLELGHGVNTQGGMYGNALQAAATGSDNETTVCLLLDYGADVNAQGWTYGNVLQAAVTGSDNEATVRLLLGRGA